MDSGWQMCVIVDSSVVTNAPLWGGSVDSRWGCAYVGQGSIWQTSVPSTPFCCGPKNALKIKWIKKNVYSKKKGK